ncbi:MAG TPA: hypothetical protein VLK30_03560 [Candidatus Limnocylindrales bacterium]|nr:hypothetical protein [Candidatus Limnocylindrales bacterium]
MPKRLAAIAAVLLVAACSGRASAPPPARSPTPLVGGLTGGLIAYASDQGIGVLDPSSGKSTIVAPIPAGAFRVAGPVWAPAPNVSHPVLYFTIHDDRPAETRTSPGAVPYDWMFRVDPFAGTIEPVAASQDSQSEGPLGLVANSHFLAMTVGCCTTYEVDGLDLTQPSGALKALARPPAQPAFFTEGAVPGDSGLIAVRQFGTGSWYWLNAEANVLNPFPLSLGPDDGPIAISGDGTMAAVALTDHGAVIQPINSALPVATPSAVASPAASPSGRATPSPSATTHASPTPAGPRRVNSRLPHPDGLAWSPDAGQLAIAVNGALELYAASAPDGTAPAGRYLGGANVVGVAWSAPLANQTYANVKASAGPQPLVDALLAATKLPAAADTPANRPLTRIYLWQFDSTKSSPIESIADATPDVLAKYPPMNAGVVFHHWAALDTWAMLGGCYRYRVVVTGSVPPIASTVGLNGSTPCSAKPSTAPSPSHSPSPSHA